MMSEAQRDKVPWVALIGPEVEENLALRYLAASLSEAGIRSEILAFNRASDLASVLNALLAAPVRPFLAAISLSFQWRAMDSLSLAVALKQKGYRGHITGGGHFGTFAWREILSDFPEIDSICRHEAERTIVELAAALERKDSLESITGLAVRTAASDPVCASIRPAPDLGSLPWPDRRGEPCCCLGHNLSPMVGSRGCYANCSFCCIAALHGQASPGRRFRMRLVEDVADEMVWQRRHRGIEIFIFHDDNFFLPGRHQSLERIHALADALEARGMGRFATVVKARPNDVSPEVFQIMRERLGCIRLFLGIENDSTQGLRTLRRRVDRERNHYAMRILANLGIYVCFNMLIFDPDTTVESFETNLTFMEAHTDCPFNFGRVELYAGTPLLERMQQEGRCRGDYLGWDYSIADAEVQRIFKIAMRCFHPRNFAEGALANRLMGTRFDVEVCRHFHPEIFQPCWLDESKDLSRRLALDSIAGLREIIAFATDGRGNRSERELVVKLNQRLRSREGEILASASDLEQRIQGAVGEPCVHYLQAAAKNG